MSEPIVIDEQGLLLFNLKDLTEGRSKYGIENTVSPDSGNPSSYIYNQSSFVNANNQLTQDTYPNICLVDGQTPALFLNLLKNVSFANDSFLHLTSFEASSLVPLIRIFKIIHPNGSNTDEEVSIEIPFETVADKIVFGPDSIFESSKGRGSGAGITSIEWKQNPKNEANLPTFKLNLKLHLQNIEEFTKIRNMSISQNGVRYDVKLEDLLYQRREWRQKTGDGTSVYDSDRYEIKIILGWQISEDGLQSIRERSNKTQQDVDKLIEAIKQQQDVFYLTFISHLLDFREDGSIDLEIFYFARADANNSNLEKANVLALSKDEEFVQKLKSLLNLLYDQYLETDNKTVDSTRITDENVIEKNLSNPTNDPIIQSLINDLKKLTSADIATYQDVISKYIEERDKNLKINLFSDLILRMTKLDYIHNMSYNKKMTEEIMKLRGRYSLFEDASIKNIRRYINQEIEIKSDIESIDVQIDGTINSEKLDLQPVISNIDEINIDGKIKNRLIYLAPDANKTQFTIDNERKLNLDPGADQVTVFAFGGTGNPRQNDTLNSLPDSNQYQKLSNELFELIKSKDFVVQPSEETGFANISFFYLSSLIDVLMDSVDVKNYNFISKKSRVILGPMTITDYSSLSSGGQYYKKFDKLTNKDKIVKVFTGKPTTINIGDIPISVKAYANWFYDNIIKVDITQITFNEFVTKLLGDLVLNALNNQVYPHAPRQKSRFAIDNFSSIAGQKNEYYFALNITNYNTMVARPPTYFEAGGFRIDQQHLQSLRTKPEDIGKDNDSSSPDYVPSKDYTVIYCLNESPYELTGDYKSDLSVGIYHIQPGNDKELVRNIKFSRSDNAARRAGNLLASLDQGRLQSKLIREKYNVSIDMFGNTNIQPGTYVFVRPFYSSGPGGLISTEQFLREIGLGGYYFVTEVLSNISVGEYKTTFRGTWSAFGDGRIGDGEIEYIKANDSEVSLGIVK